MRQACGLYSDGSFCFLFVSDLIVEATTTSEFKQYERGGAGNIETLNRTIKISLIKFVVHNTLFLVDHSGSATDRTRSDTGGARGTYAVLS